MDWVIAHEVAERRVEETNGRAIYFECEWPERIFHLKKSAEFSSFDVWSWRKFIGTSGQFQAAKPAAGHVVFFYGEMIVASRTKALNEI